MFLGHIQRLTGLFSGKEQPNRYNCQIGVGELQAAVRAMPEGEVDPQVRDMIAEVAKHIGEFKYLLDNLDYMNLPENRRVNVGDFRGVDTIYQFVNDNFFSQTYHQRIGQFQEVAPAPVQESDPSSRTFKPWKGRSYTNG